jgi:hypothetical protein
MAWAHNHHNDTSQSSVKFSREGSKLLPERSHSSRQHHPYHAENGARFVSTGVMKAARPSMGDRQNKTEGTAENKTVASDTMIVHPR